MIAALSEVVGRVHLLTDRVPDDLAPLVAGHPQLKVHALGKPRFHQRAASLLERLVRAEAVDVIHDTFGHLSAFFQRIAPEPDRAVRLVTTQYTTVWGWYARVRPTELMSSWRYALIRTVGLWRDRRLCPLADRVVVLGPGHEADLIEGHGVAPERVSWLPSEIDTDTFTLAPFEGRAWAQGEGPVLLYTGTIFRNKGIDTLLQAVAAVGRRWPGLRLVMLGEVPAWERAWVAAQIEASGAAPFLEMPGKVPRAALLDWYRRADLYVFPSLFEGSPRSLREALACGCPAVASDIPGHRGIDPEGDFIWFAPVKDVAGWTEALEAALSEPAAARRDRGGRGAARLRSHHSPQAVAQALSRVYADVMASPAGGRR